MDRSSVLCLDIEVSKREAVLEKMVTKWKLSSSKSDGLKGSNKGKERRWSGLMTRASKTDVFPGEGSDPEAAVRNQWTLALLIGLDIAGVWEENATTYESSGERWPQQVRWIVFNAQIKEPSRDEV